MSRTRAIVAGVFFALAGACVLGMIAAGIYDAVHYSPRADSAPLSAFLFIRAIEFGLPALILVAIGVIIRRPPALFK